LQTQPGQKMSAPTAILKGPEPSTAHAILAKPEKTESKEVKHFNTLTAWQKKDLIDSKHVAVGHAINAASPLADVTIAESTGMTVFYAENEAKEKDAYSQTAVVVGSQGSAKTTTVWHGPKWGVQSPDFWSGAHLNKRDTLHNSNSDHPSQAVRIGETELCWWPAPKGVKPLPLAKPIKGEAVHIWTSSEQRRIKNAPGFILEEGIEHTFKNPINGELTTYKGLWVASYSNKGGFSGAPVTNSKGQVVGWHVSGKTIENSPAYFQPVTDEILAAINAPNPKNY